MQNKLQNICGWLIMFSLKIEQFWNFRHPKNFSYFKTEVITEI